MVSTMRDVAVDLVCRYSLLQKESKDKIDHLNRRAAHLEQELLKKAAEGAQLQAEKDALEAEMNAKFSKERTELARRYTDALRSKTALMDEVSRVLEKYKVSKVRELDWKS